MSTFATLLKREYWEHKTGFQWTPLIIAGITIFAVILGVFVFSTNDVKINNVGGYSISDLFALYDASVDPGKKALVAQMSTYSAIFTFFFVLAIVSFFYCLGALYDDRKDKSILFWKSLPVSDTQTVLSKVVIVMVLAPLAFWIVMVATNVAVMMLATVFAWIADASAWDSIWAPSNFFMVSGYQLVASYMAVLWAAPFIGYLLLVSSWTKKVPFLVATVPVTLLIIAESIVSNSIHVVSEIGVRFQGIFASLALPVKYLAGDLSQQFGIEDGDWLERKLDLDSYSELLMNFDLWIGFVFAAICIAGAVYIRRYRDEAL